MLTKFEHDFLAACQEVVARQQELMPALAATLGVQTEKIFYLWASKCVEQSGHVHGTAWRYFFHGLECDLEHVEDKRFLRVDFGPQGRLDTFTGGGVMQYVMCARYPWREFPALRAYPARETPPYNGWYGSFDSMTAIHNRLMELKLIKICDSALQPYVTQHTTTGPLGCVVNLPPSAPERTWIDSMVCNRLQLSDLGRQALIQSMTG